MSEPTTAHAPVIELRQVAKGYRLYDSPQARLRELLFRRPLHRVHFALQNIDLTVNAGETVGVIGENGAGKSTLLKVIAGTCKPTAGTVTVRGRIAALLELGAGFHPEQSGRDNVHLMGALSGVSAAQMAAYYDEIAAFAELPAEALQRPVKTYSSGMFMRLAFATATAIEPDILIIDEALAVGDLYFQKKSLDRIMTFRARGKTVLFCGHNLYHIRSLCQRTAWIHEGQLRALGDSEAVVTAYEAHERAKLGGAGNDFDRAYRPSQPSTAPIRIKSVAVIDEQGQTVQIRQTGQTLGIAVTVEIATVGAFHVGVAVVRGQKDNVFGTSTHFGAEPQPLRGLGEQRLVLWLPQLALLSGEYAVSVYALDDSGLQVFDLAEQICPFTVSHPHQEFGVVGLPFRWERSAS